LGISGGKKIKPHFHKTAAGFQEKTKRYFEAGYDSTWLEIISRGDAEARGFHNEFEFFFVHLNVL